VQAAAAPPIVIVGRCCVASKKDKSLGADHDCTLSPRHQPLAFLSPLPYLSAMLSSAYLSRKLTSPIPTKDGGTLRTIGEACEYMAAIGKERELCRHWQQVRELMLGKPTWQPSARASGLRF